MVRRAFVLSLAMIFWCGSGAALTRARKHRHHKATPVAGHTHSPGRRHHWWRRIFWDPVFRPSHDSLLKQNAEIDRLELPRIQDDAELEQLKVEGKLVPIVPGTTIRFDPRLDPDRRYCRPWTREFVEDLADAYYQQFHDQIQVNSAVRTVEVQKKLRRHNRNAAPAEGEIASSHLAGVTVDLQRRGMSKVQIKWVENYLMPLKAAGLVEPEEERRQWVFHIMVSDHYSEARDQDEVAQRGLYELPTQAGQTLRMAGSTNSVIELGPLDPSVPFVAVKPLVPEATSAAANETSAAPASANSAASTPTSSTAEPQVPVSDETDPQ
jgi:hypothetical protein